MILEVAMLDIIPNRISQFEEAFEVAKTIISRQQGFVSLTLQRCLEKSNRFVLLVYWSTLEAHTIGFRGSTDYLEWKTLLHHFYDPFPSVEHYQVRFATHRT